MDDPGAAAGHAPRQHRLSPHAGGGGPPPVPPSPSPLDLSTAASASAYRRLSPSLRPPAHPQYGCLELEADNFALPPENVRLGSTFQRLYGDLDGPALCCHCIACTILGKCIDGDSMSIYLYESAAGSLFTTVANCIISTKKMLHLICIDG